MTSESAKGEDAEQLLSNDGTATPLLAPLPLAEAGSEELKPA